MVKPFAMSVGILTLGLAATAPALTVSFHFDGAGNARSANPLIMSTGLVNDPGSPALGIAYAYSPASGDANAFGGYDDFMGTGVLTLSDGTIDFGFDGSNDGAGDLVGAVLDFSGGTGAYAGVTGQGLVSHTMGSPNKVEGQFNADLTPAPEPAPALALAMTSVSLLRRRMQKAN